MQAIICTLESSNFIINNKSILSINRRESKTEDVVEGPITPEMQIDPTILPSSLEEPAVILKADKSIEREGEGYSGSEDSDSNQKEKSSGVKIPKERRPYYESTEKYRKTLRLTSEQIVSHTVIPK